MYDISQRLNVSLPQEPSKQVLDDLGIEKIIQVSTPSNIHRQGPLKRINGHWTETWDEPTPVLPPLVNIHHRRHDPRVLGNHGYR